LDAKEDTRAGCRGRPTDGFEKKSWDKRLDFESQRNSGNEA